MVNKSEQIPWSKNFTVEKDNFVIPQETYNQMVYDILGVKKITEEVILSLLNIKGDTKKRITEICNQKGKSVEDFLKRSRVWLRIEKDIENRSLLEYWKWYIGNASKLTDSEIIDIVKKDIKNRSRNNIVKWPDWDINYIETQDAVLENRERLKIKQEKTEALKENGINKRTKILASLGESDKNELDVEVQRALNLSKKISKWKWVEIYLKSWRCKESKKLTSVAAQKYFHKEYSRLYTEKFPDIKNELYPPDREIVVIPLSNNGKHVCKVRWEREIINIVVNKINNWKIKLLDYIIDENNKEMTERNRAHVEMVLQKIIDEYYQFLRLYEYKCNNDLWQKRPFFLDLETISTKFRTLKDKKNHTLSHEEFSEKLKNQKIKSIREKAKGDKSTKAKEEELINNIPEFTWFDWFLDFYKDYFESALDNEDPSLRLRIPSRVQILEKYWFIYLKQWSKMNVNWNIIVTLQPEKQKSL